jgi:hypothetical protein
VTRYALPGAKRFSVWFCNRCGTRVPHKIPDRDDYMVPAGILDHDPGKRPEQNIFWDSRAPWYVGTDGMPKFKEYP